MNAIRKLIDNADEQITITLPSNYRNKKIEVIILEYEEQKPVKERKLFYGCLKGCIEMSDDFDALLEDFKEYME
jgi:hypothetical protein